MKHFIKSILLIVILSCFQVSGHAQIFELIIKVASGERTKSEIHGYGQSEFVPWQIGAVM